MLLYTTARLDKVQPNAAAATTAAKSFSAATAHKSPDQPTAPFARFPHALAADKRLSPTDRLVACALTWWAWGDRPTAAMSNRAIAAYVGVSVPTVERSMRVLARLGYIRTEAVKPTAANMTGRVVTLRWVEDPTVLPALPARSADVTPARLADRLAVAADGPSPMMDPPHQEGGGGSIAGEGPPPSPAMDKESSRQELENLENAGADEAGRQRPEPTPLPAQVHGCTVAPTAIPARPLAAEPILTGPIDVAVFEARQLAALTANHIADVVHIVEPGQVAKGGAKRAIPEEVGLTPGQRAALEAMTGDQRRAFDAKSPGMRAQILAPFAGGFDPKILATVVRAQLAVPRFVAQAQPPDNSTAGLLAQVAAGDPRRVADLADALVRELGGAGDRRRFGALFALAGQVLAREVSPEVVLDALRQAKGPKAEVPGAVFVHALRAHGWRPRSSRRSLT